jgi:hypothetical protein
MTTVLTELGEFSSLNAKAEGGSLWMGAADLDQSTGWTLKPEGFCQGPVCVPIPAGRRSEFVQGDRVNAAAMWTHLGNEVCHSEDESVWVLGEGAARRTEALRSLEAPDFTLPDKDGRLHRLSDHRGKKVLLVSWASW